MPPRHRRIFPINRPQPLPPLLRPQQLHWVHTHPLPHRRLRHRPARPPSPHPPASLRRAPATRTPPWRRLACPSATHVQPLTGYQLQLTFSDGATGTIDLQSRILNRGGMFSPLEDLAFFRSVQLDPQAGTLCWPNGLDLCPDVLYSLATGNPLPVPHATR
ncbi:MAG: DUF2442 domain-containing protein [Bryobacterales bacterium]|nr:DUF2442 domain-containing protein [Bryobacterales bacterium]